MRLRLACVQAERDALYRLRRSHRINDDTLRELVHELDLAELVMRRRSQAERLAGLTEQHVAEVSKR